ncbi:MAG: PAS domain S-box protein [Thiobacillus sp.]|nr:PAS domain S-box protein [Thiobacillus sp.]
MLSRLSPEAESAPPANVILHELLVHKVELEMQIEELRRAHDAMEEARDRYLDLYDFAPVGYITLNRDCLISEVNLTGAALLGTGRTKLVQSRFAKFVSAPERDLWHRLFLNLMEQSETGKRTLVLEMARADASTFYGYLECQRRAATDGAPTLRLALFDISKIKQAEADMLNAATGFEGLKA